MTPKENYIKENPTFIICEKSCSNPMMFFYSFFNKMKILAFQF